MAAHPGGPAVAGTGDASHRASPPLVDTERFLVSARAISDPGIYRRELESIFTRAWVVVAHESEVPVPGAFVTRYIGEDPVIVVRDRDGLLHVLLNACRHRGMQVCRAEIGNAASFRCPYHGWTYDTSGRLKGVPAKRLMYGDQFDESQWGLREARVGTYVGMVFACWDESAPTLDDYLGDMKWYLDIMFARSDRGMEVVGVPQRWIIDSNWKLPAEQFAGDAYHAGSLHRSLAELGSFRSDNAKALPEVVGLHGIDVSTEQGHSVRCVDMSGLFEGIADIHGAEHLDVLKAAPPAGMSVSMVEHIPRHLDADQIRVLAENPPVLGSIFPNLAILNFMIAVPGHEPAGCITVKTWNPRGPGRTEVFTWVLVERDAASEVREQGRRMTILTFSDSGIFEQDDAEAWSGIQRALGGVIGERQSLYYGAQLGVARPDDWAGGGDVFAGVSKDDSQWRFWTRWHDYVTGAV